ncbi:MAG: hypothetical protein SGJ27_09040 [Candidatus Melainabacteria bacterium]|nr:hypothetical protein [Candidatus Melainabacteria bacterium]
MSKITTEICKIELNKRSPIEGQKSPADWKRITKNGTAKTAIVRIFQHRTRPLFGIVTDQNDQITTVKFTDLLGTAKQIAAESTAGATDSIAQAEAADSTTDDTTGGAARQPGQAASNGKVSADEFVFAVCERDNRRTTFAICDKDFWRANHYLSDLGCGDLLDGLLPPGTSVASENQYSSKMKRKELYEFLLAQGFLDDERFTTFMDGYQPDCD